MDPLIDPAGRNLTTERLRLRSWRAADVEPMLAMSTDPDVMRHFPRPMTRGEVESFVVRQRRILEAGRPGLYAVALRDDHRFIGFTGLATPRFDAPFTPCVEIGWRLVRGAWGHGYATEAARACLRHGFEDLDLGEIVSFTAVVNERSQRVMQRIGMHTDPAEDFDHPLVDVGHPVRRHVLYRLTGDEWRSRQGGEV